MSLSAILRRKPYIPEFNCFVRRWMSLGGGNLPILIRHENNPGTLTFYPESRHVALEVKRNPRVWSIYPDSMSCKFEIKLINNRTTLVLYDFFHPRSIPDYW